MSTKKMTKRVVSFVLTVLMVISMMPATVFAWDAPATQYVARRWENGQVVSETKTQNDVAWMTNGHLEWHNGWWYTRDLDELVISDRVSVDNGATANLILMDGKTIKFENGIHVGKGSTLNIYGQAQGTGKLIVGKSKADTAAIGGNAGESNGTINIYGGTIEVTGGSHSSNGGAGIGAGGTASNESSINIYGGTITSTGGANAAGIGGGARGGHGGAIAIYGGYVTAKGDSGAAGIGGGEGGSGTGTFIHGGEVHAKGGAASADGGSGIGSGSKAGRDGVVGGNVYIYGGKVYAEGGTDGAGIGGGNEVNGGNVYINGVNGGAYVEAEGGGDAAGIGGGDGASGGTVEIREGTVKATGGGFAAGIGSGDADGENIHGGIVKIYGGDVTATGGSYSAGIGGGQGGSGATVDIYGGKVTAIGGTYSSNMNCGAGIGSGFKDGRETINAGKTTIHGGQVIATGGPYGAGIGGGGGVAGGEIYINGGTVEATGGLSGAGIGGGESANGGKIEITGGTVTATGGSDAAGIGGGEYGTGGDIKISGGTITADGGNYAAGIGGGDDAAGGTINITGGTITAKGGVDGAGIGGGEDGAGGNITINSASDELIKATSEKKNSLGAGIGGGECGGAGTINIINGKIEATGGSWEKDISVIYCFGAAGIGTGDDGRGGTITISGGDIKASGGMTAAGIGGGREGYVDKIEIKGGNVNATGSSGIADDYDKGGAGIGGGDHAANRIIEITGGDINAQGGHGAAGIGGGTHGEGGTITISGGKVNATNGSTQNIIGAAIGGGLESKSGTIKITAGEVYAHGRNGGAGIGSGFNCTDEENAVDVTIDGGNVTAETGEGFSYWRNKLSKRNIYAGAAIGASGCSYDLDDKLVDNTYFSGTIRFNGGNVKVVSWGVTPIGTTSDDGLLEDSGRVEFNGATVQKVTHRSVNWQSSMVRAKDIILKEDDSLHQFVLFDDDWYEDWNNPSGIALKDDRINTMQTADHRHLLVGPCDHRGITIVDNGTDHSSSCKYCTYETSHEAHTYGNPAWTWGENHASAVAKFTCSVCKHVETLNAAVTTEEFEATGDAPAKTVYTAKATLAGQEYTDVVEMLHGLPNATITTEPKAKTLTYKGHEQQLITAGAATGGQMLYALGDESGATEEFTETIPVGTDAGDYKVWYMVKGDSGHNDIPAKSMDATIAKADFSAVEFTLTPNEAAYTGSAITPELKGTFNSGTAENPDTITLDTSEYSFSFANNTNAGKATVSITSSEKNFTGGTTNLEFEIKKAPNNVTVSMVGWAKGEEASTPDVTADFGADTASLEYKVKGADDGTYTGIVPSEIGEYTVKATIAGSSNYESGEATCDFEIIKKKYTVTFNPNDGTGTKEAESIAENGSYILPSADTFGAPEGKCRLKAWEVKIGSAEPVEKAPGASITVTADTMVKALWDDHVWSPVEYKWSDDNSQVTATRTCGNDSSHIETETAETTSEVTKEVTEEEAGTRTYTATFRNPAFETQTKEDVIPKLEFVDVTFIGSSIDGDDEEAPHTVAEPYTVRIPKGTTIEDLADNDQDKYKEIIDHFTKGKYAPYNKEVYMTSKPLSNYNNWSDLEDADQYWEEIDSDTTFYLALCKLVDSIDLTVEKPLCDTDMAKGPIVSVKDGSLVTLEAGRTKWWDRETGKTILSGTIEGEKTYGVRAYLDPVFGYGIDDDSSAPAITVENSDSDSVQVDAYGSMAKITFAVTADHDWEAAPTYTWADDNKKVTATHACKVCKHEESETVNTTSKVTKEATEDAEGETTYTATFANPAFETQTKKVPIPKIEHEKVKVIIHFSSIDGDDLMPPVTLETNKYGLTRYEHVFTNNGYNKNSTFFVHPDYIDTGYRTTDSLINHVAAGYNANGMSYLDFINHDTHVYEMMYKKIDEVSVGIEAPKCGTEVTVDDDGNQSNPPIITTAGDHYRADDGEMRATWVDDDWNAFAGTLEGGKEYRASLGLISDYGYAFDSNVKINVDGGTVAETDKWDRGIEILAKVKVEHDWDTPSYEWASDNSSVTATRVCKNDDKHVETETVKTTSEVTKEPTEDAEGETTYTATFENDAFEDQSKTVANIDALDHAWGFDGFTWTGDSENGYTSVVGNYKCKNDASHTETVSAKLDVTRDEPSCTHTGSATYTATISKDDSKDGVEHTESKKTTLKELAHTPGDAVKENEVAATCTTDGSYDEVTKCTECNKQLSSKHVVVPATGHKWNDWKTVKEATETVNGEEERTCQNDETHKETRVIPSKNHVHELTHFAAKDSTCTETGNKEHWICDKGENPCGRYFADDAGKTEITADDLVVAMTDHTPGEVEIKNKIEPTCTRAGEHDEYTYCTVCKKELTHEHKVDPAIDHKWGEPSYEWEQVEENWKATATRVCANDASHIETETVYAKSEITKEATCEARGETTYTATFANADFAEQTKTVEDIDALGHDWSEWIVSKEATETETGLEERVCKNDPTHVETRKIPVIGHVHELTKVEAKDATCTEDGNIEYWICDRGDNPCDRYFADAEGKKEINKEDTIIKATNHDWDEPTYEWSDDNSTVTATRVCKNDPNEIETETAKTTSEVTKEPTEEEEGETTYTATFKNPAFTKQTNTESIPELNHEHKLVKTDAKDATCEENGNIAYWTCTSCGKIYKDAEGKEEIKKADTVIKATDHVWDEPTYEWASDNSSVTATRVCKNDKDHVETETAKTTSEVTKEASETEEGEKTYTATFTNPVFKKQTKTEVIPKLDPSDDPTDPVDPTPSDDPTDPVDPKPGDDPQPSDDPTDPVDPTPGDNPTDPVDPTPSGDPTDPVDPTPGDNPTDPVNPTPSGDPTDPVDPTPSGDLLYRNTEGDGTKWAEDSNITADFTFKRTVDDEVTFSHFTGIQVDGKDVDESNYIAEPGSVIIKLRSSYLETLAVGEHTLTAMFNDGNSASAKFTILAKSTNTNSPTSSGTAKKANVVNTSTTALKTGDTGNMLLWLTVLCASMLVLFVAISVCRRNTIGRR